MQSCSGVVVKNVKIIDVCAIDRDDEMCSLASKINWLYFGASECSLRRAFRAVKVSIVCLRCSVT